MVAAVLGVAVLAVVTRPEAAFLRAVALEAAGRPAEALAAADLVGGALPDLDDRLAFLRGRALEALGRGDEAAAAYAAVRDDSLRSAAARLARARLLGAAGRRAPALDALAPLLASPPPGAEGPDPAAAALLLAASLQAAGPEPDFAGARRSLLECWAGHPLAPEAPRCRRALERLPGEHGAMPAPEHAARRAEGLLSGNRTAAAVRELRALLPGLSAPDAGEPLACRVRLALGRAYRRERQYVRAIAFLRPLAERCADAAVRANALHLLAEALAGRGAAREAIATFRRLARDDAASALAHEAMFAAADLLARDGSLADAARAFAAVARDAPLGALRDEARFRVAWLARKTGDADAAIAQLLAIEADARGKDSYEEARAAYWRARLVAQSDRGAARAIWADLAARFPVSYYGVVARARLDEAGSGEALLSRAPDAPPAPVIDDAGDLGLDPHFRAGVALLRIGLDRAAAEELNAIDIARLRDHDARPALLVADLLHRAGDARSASLLLRTVGRVAFRRGPEGLNLRLWRVAYPPTFREHIARWAPRASVPVDLFHALIREESALDPRAVSPAGAVGLSQLMLPTAREIARALRMRRPTRDDLESPAVSIRIGSRYLGDLLGRFRGSIPLALASYNAGPGAVARWLAERGDLEIDEFVEEIPYEETRGYVKRVLRSFAAYRVLYAADSQAPVEVQLARRSARDPGPRRHRPSTP